MDIALIVAIAVNEWPAKETSGLIDSRRWGICWSFSG
jgi:hypothetical protein